VGIKCFMQLGLAELACCWADALENVNDTTEMARQKLQRQPTVAAAVS